MRMSQTPGPCLILARKDWMANQANLHPDIANMIAWTGPGLEPSTAAQPTKDHGQENAMKMVYAAIASQIFRKYLPHILEIVRVYLDLQAITSLGDPCSRLEPILKSKGKISDSAGLSPCQARCKNQTALGSIWAQHETILSSSSSKFDQKFGIQEEQKSGSDKSERPCFRGIWTVPFCPACRRTWSVQ